MTTPTEAGPIQARTDAALPSPTSLRGAALAAAARGEPLVVMTTLPGCVYCDLVRNHHLLPMRKEGKVQAVQLNVTDRTSHLQGFQSNSTTPAEQATVWKARFTPTVLFFGPDGKELAERLVGVAVPDFYGEYLDARLAEARRKLNK